MRREFNGKSLGDGRRWLELHVRPILENLRSEQIPVQVQGRLWDFLSILRNWRGESEGKEEIEGNEWEIFWEERSGTEGEERSETEGEEVSEQGWKKYRNNRGRSIGRAK